MALETNAELWIGEDHQFVFTVYNAAQTAIVDITAWALSWMLKKRPSDADSAKLLQKQTGGSGIAIAGSYSAAPETNTQAATVSIADTDTDDLKPGVYYYELKRTDAGNEAPLAYGALNLRQGVHRT